MSLTPIQLQRLQRVMESLKRIVADGGTPASQEISTTAHRRRSGKELAAFRKALAAERRRGTPVSELAQRHGVSPSYIYQLPLVSGPTSKARKVAKDVRDRPARRSRKKTRTSSAPRDVSQPAPAVPEAVT